MQGMCKIGAYLYIFHEKDSDSGFRWESRSAKYRNNDNKNIFSYVLSSHFPFLIVSIAVMILFFYTTKWNKICTIYEMVKVIICIALNVLLLLIIYKNRKISTNDYVVRWNGIK